MADAATGKPTVSPSSGQGKGLVGTLKSKAGPLPVWAWVAIVTGLVAIYLWRKKSKALPPATDPGPQVDASAAQDQASYQSGMDNSLYPQIPVGTADSPTPVSPPTDITRTGTPVVAPAPVPGATTTKPTPPPKPAPPRRTYTVKPWPLPGSSLSSIAQIEYGNAGEWTKIYAANKGLIGPNANLIHPGQVLVIP